MRAAFTFPLDRHGLSDSQEVILERIYKARERLLVAAELLGRLENEVKAGEEREAEKVLEVVGG